MQDDVIRGGGVEEEAQRTQQMDVSVPQGFPVGARPVILPNSVKGDMVHMVCSVVLDWMLETGNAGVVCKARKIKRHWEKEQGWIIAWGNTSRFFELVAHATQSPETYQEMRRIAPSEGESVDRILMLVDRAVQRVEASRSSSQPNRRKSRVVQLNRYKKQPGLNGVKPLKREA